MRNFIMWNLAALFALALPGRAELLAGAARVDITPDVNAHKVLLNGYTARWYKPAQDVHDPVYARTLWLEQEGRRVILVGVDLCLMSQDLRAMTLAELEALRVDESEIIFFASHTHSGPGGMDSRGVMRALFGPYDPELTSFTAKRIAQSVIYAEKSKVQARLGFASVQAPGLTLNRRDRAYRPARRDFAETYNKAEPRNVTDDTITVMKVEALSGKTISVLFNFATHATILGEDNLLISGDWPGRFLAEAEKNLPAGAVALFMNGAEGDQAPNSTGDNDYERVERFALQVWEAGKPLLDQAEMEEEVIIDSAFAWYELPPFRPLGIWFPRGLTPGYFRSMPLAAARIGPAVIMAVPAEVISSLGREMKEQAVAMGYAFPMIACPANDWFGYVTTPEEYQAGGYEAQMTLFGKDEGPWLITKMALLLNELQ